MTQGPSVLAPTRVLVHRNGKREPVSFFLKTFKDASVLSDAPRYTWIPIAGIYDTRSCPMRWKDILGT